MANRYPDDYEITQDFEIDSARRDLTINSLGITKDGEIIDYQGGVDDIKAKLIRAVGEPRERFKEDALRLLRTLRFAARLGFSIEPETLSAVKELKDLIDSISMERVRDELLKTAEHGGDALANFVEHMDDVGLLEKLLPEVKALQGMEQPKDHHPEGDAYQHTLAALRTSRTNDPITNLAILFHDLGKDSTTLGYKDKEKKIPTYWGHHHRSNELVAQVGKRLKLSNDQIKALQFVAENHMLGFAVKQGMKKSKVLALRNDPNWPHLKENLWADIMSRGLPREDEFEEIIDIFDKAQSELGEKEEFEDKMRALVDGRKIMELVPGIKGHDIGSIKDQTREMIVKKKFDITPEEVNTYIKKLAMML